jgi:hypothetical protein
MFERATIYAMQRESGKWGKGEPKSKGVKFCQQYRTASYAKKRSGNQIGNSD